MPIQKDLKKIVRARMQKTGEAYTTARLHVVSKKQPPVDYAELAGMSDEAVKKATGRDWASWVKTLDAVKANEKPHREIAEYVKSLGTPDWWSQGVTVGYERIRGLRDKGQRRGGSYEANKSRTFAVPVTKLFDAFAVARTRRRWLPDKSVVVRKATSPRSVRLTMKDGTSVEVWLVAKGAGKSSAQIQHRSLPTKESATERKAFWSERLDFLAEILEPGTKQKR